MMMQPTLTQVPHGRRRTTPHNSTWRSTHHATWRNTACNMPRLQHEHDAAMKRPMQALHMRAERSLRARSIGRIEKRWRADTCLQVWNDRSIADIGMGGFPAGARIPRMDAIARVRQARMDL